MSANIHKLINEFNQLKNSIASMVFFVYTNKDGKVAKRWVNINTSYLGKTSYNSLAYLIKHTDLHLGFDSFPVHLASHYNKKIVALYPQYARNSGPFFSNKKDIYLFESIRYTKNVKPIFENDDPTKSIDEILPEHIAEAVLDLLYRQKM